MLNIGYSVSFGAYLGQWICEEGFFQAPGLSENIAKTAAAQVGYLSNLAGEAPPVGFIGAIKNLSIEQLPKIGDQLITEIEIEHEIMKLY